MQVKWESGGKVGTVFDLPLAFYDLCKCLQWLADEKDLAWTKDLPKCPCDAPSRLTKLSDIYNKEGRERDKNPFLWKHHRGVSSCYRSSPNEKGQRQQCCYDMKGKLITEGPGAGTPDKASDDWKLIGRRHGQKDVDPYEWCGGWQLYNIARPPDNRNNCPINYGN